MRLPRASGLLLHPTSLPGRFGIGDLGPEAHTFARFLAETGQRWWQILPLGPTGYGNSPYQSYSSHAGSTLLISPENLVADGFLDETDLADYPNLSEARVEFEEVADAKEMVLRRAFQRFPAQHPEIQAFVQANRDWLDDYALFMAIKRSRGGAAWYDWGPELSARSPEAMERAKAALVDEIRYHQFGQYLFSRQWKALRERCAELQIGLIGDLPIFVAQDSVDVWARPELFQLDERGHPLVVAGVPPDYFSETGQLWGNPLYQWNAHAEERFAWWIARLRSVLARVDLVRLDHFRGFEAYWEIPAGSETAATGRWALGPGIAFLDAMREGLGGLPIIAEDLGDITPEVEALRDRFELPGMKVLQFGFGGDPGTSIHLPHQYQNHCIAYTGTHDNETSVGWFYTTRVESTQTPEQIALERAFALRYLGTNGEEFHWDLIRIAQASVADTVIIPLQDVLGIDSSGRMNTPGVAEGNWTWRYQASQLDPRASARLAEMTALYARWNGPKSPATGSPQREVLEAPVLGR